MEFSQQRTRAPHNMESVPETRPSQTANFAPHTKRTQGIALVVVLLSAMVLMVSMLAISATMAISSQRTTVDQSATLQAQYAAESGIAYGQERFTEAMALFPLLTFEQTVGRATVKAAIDDYCGASSKGVSSVVGENYCGGEATNSSRKFTLFATYITDVSGADSEDAPYVSSYPSATTDLAARQTFWRDMFAGPNITRTVNAAAPNGTSATYTVKYGFTPTNVKNILGGYRVFFEPVPIESVGTVLVSGKVIASRKLATTPTVQRFSIDVSRSSFSNYNYFVNRRLLPTSLGGGTLNFSDNDSFEGKVHVNASEKFRGAAWFNNSTSQKGARFYGGFTSAQKEFNWTNAVGDPKLMFPGTYKLEADVIDLPPNATSQRRAVIGGDSEDTSDMKSDEIAKSYGISNTKDADLPMGVYYGKNQQINSTWGGGIYVKGNVDDLKLTTRDGLQVITIKQADSLGTTITTTTFTQTNLSTNADGSPKSSWTMTQSATKAGKTTTTNQTINNGNFNGLVYVEGNIGDSGSNLDSGNSDGLGGEGTNDQSTAGITNEIPDIAPKTQLTIAATGNIFIKRNLTYTDDPKTVVDNPSTTADESAQNVLGIYSESGNIKVDGVAKKNIKVQASIMAVGKDGDAKLNSLVEGNGFGTNNYTAYRNGTTTTSRPQIELLGGIIEEQSQGVGGQTGSNQFGYSRNFAWDKRFDSGFTPPYFPTQLRFTQKCQEGDPSVGNAVGPTCARNTQMVWVTKAN